MYVIVVSRPSDDGMREIVAGDLLSIRLEYWPTDEGGRHWEWFVKIYIDGLDFPASLAFRSYDEARSLYLTALKYCLREPGVTIITPEEVIGYDIGLEDVIIRDVAKLLAGVSDDEQKED